MSRKVACLIRHTPYGSDFAQSAIDAVLALGVYDLEVTLVFLGDGVFQLLPDLSLPPKVENPYPKSISKKLAALELYDIDRVFACAHSLQQRGLQGSPLVTAEPLDNAALKTLCAQQDVLLNF